METPTVPLIPSLKSSNPQSTPNDLLGMLIDYILHSFEIG